MRYRFLRATAAILVLAGAALVTAAEPARVVDKTFAPGGLVTMELAAGKYTIQGTANPRIDLTWDTRDPHDASKVWTGVETSGTTAPRDRRATRWVRGSNRGFLQLRPDDPAVRRRSDDRPGCRQQGRIRLGRRHEDRRGEDRRVHVGRRVGDSRRLESRTIRHQQGRFVSIVYLDGARHARSACASDGGTDYLAGSRGAALTYAAGWSARSTSATMPLSDSSDRSQSTSAAASSRRPITQSSVTTPL